LKKFATVLLALPMIFFFQNCGGGGLVNELGKGITGGGIGDPASVTSAASTNDTDNSGSGGGNPGEPPVPQPATDCLADSSANACLFYKNVVDANGGAMPSYSYSSDLTDLQNYAVDIEGLDGSGYLQNSTIIVENAGATRTRATSNGDFKYLYKDNDPNKHLSQVSAYYWCMATNELFESNGGSPATGGGLSIEAFDGSYANGSYNPVTNSLQLGYFTNFDGNPHEVALMGEVVVHEFGHAIAGYASDLNMNLQNSSTHRDCAGTRCCRQKEGCTGAINEAQADFQAALMFQDSPGMLNIRSNDLIGSMGQMNLPRNPEAIGSPSIEFLFERPSTFGFDANGHFYTLALAYTSAWWDAYLDAKAAGVHKELEQLFIEHLSPIGSTDTFETALDKALTIDQTLFGSRHSSRLRTAFAARGIQPTSL
jgi:hypothetical protein